MSRRKKDEELEKIEKLERELKSQRTINRSLMRHLKKLNRDFNIQEFTDEEYLDEFNENIQSEKCPDCSKSNLILVDMGPMQFKRCELCLYKTKTVKKKN